MWKALRQYQRQAASRCRLLDPHARFGAMQPGQLARRIGDRASGGEAGVPVISPIEQMRRPRHGER